MLKFKFLPVVSLSFYDNDTSAFNPQLWANESLAILEENMVMGQLVHRDFEPIVAAYGETVNTRRPGEFKAKRKTTTDNVTVQDVTATNVQVSLNQHIHVSFLIHDGEESKSFKDLIEVYLAPAMLAQARIIDQILLGQVMQFLKYNGGQLGQLTSARAKADILDTRTKLNVNKAYMAGRNMIFTPNSEAQVLKLDLFTQANTVGDDGTALREASLGRKLGFDMFMCQNASSVLPGNTTIVGAINLSGGYAAGYAGSIVVNGFTGALTVNQFVTIAGDYTVYRVAAHSETLGNTTAMTLDRPLQYAVANSAVVTGYVAGAVNQSVSPTGYASGYAKEITVDGFTVAPQVGQAVTFGIVAGSPVYTIIDVNALVGITLDRPLDAAIADNALVNLGPAGDYNFAFHRNALALVVRPLAMPKAGTGALSAVVNYNDLSMRATITYDGNKQGHLVTLDMLCGIAILDQHLGAVLLG